MRALKPLIIASALAASTVANAAFIPQFGYDVTTVFDTSSIVWSAGTTGTVATAPLLSWGTTSPKSNLGVGGNVVGGTIFTDGAAAPSAQFTHTNNPIQGSHLSAVTVNSTLQLYAGATPLLGPSGATLNYLVRFEETPNDSTCVGNTSGPNSMRNPPCNDIFVITGNLNAGSFVIDDYTYYVSFVLPTELVALNSIYGAGVCEAAGAPANCMGFTTKENQQTQVQFGLRITSAPYGVPEPGGLVLAATALMLAGLKLRRRQRDQA